MAEAERDEPVVRDTRDTAILSVLRAARLLELIGDLGEGGVSDLARRLGWTKSTVHRFASTLTRIGYLEQDAKTGRYRLGLRLFELGNSAIRARELRHQAVPILEALMQATQETVHLAVLDEARMEVVYVHKVEPPQAIRLYTEIGAHHPAYCAATGKAILAFLPEARRARLLQGATLRPATPRTIVDPDVLVTHLAEIRQRGYAVDDEEYREGVRGVAAPVFDHTGQVVAAVNVGGPASRLTPERITMLAPLVQQAASEIASNLGYRRATRGGADDGSIRSGQTHRPHHNGGGERHTSADALVGAAHRGDTGAFPRLR